MKPGAFRDRVRGQKANHHLGIILGAFGDHLRSLGYAVVGRNSVENRNDWVAGFCDQVVLVMFEILPRQQNLWVNLGRIPYKKMIKNQQFHSHCIGFFAISIAA
jgi:hypothetical protein